MQAAAIMTCHVVNTWLNMSGVDMHPSSNHLQPLTNDNVKVQAHIHTFTQQTYPDTHIDSHDCNRSSGRPGGLASRSISKQLPSSNKKHNNSKTQVAPHTPTQQHITTQPQIYNAHPHTHNNQMCKFCPKVFFVAAGASRVQSVSEQLRLFAL